MKKRLEMKKIAFSLLILTTFSCAKDYVNSLGMTFKEIPTGSYIMGLQLPDTSDCPKDNPYTEKNEYKDCVNEHLEKNGLDEYDVASQTPAHKVSIKSFYMGETEVTQEQWYTIMGNNPSYFQNGNPKVPVENVSWEDVQKFISRLNKIEHTHKYRLPTEEEWEYADRASTTTKWYCGNDEACAYKIGWYRGNSNGWPQQVATKQSNAWGLYDMNGNIGELTSSCFSEGYNSKPDCSKRVIRGGSTGFPVAGSTSAVRDVFYSISGSTGFRVAKTK